MCACSPRVAPAIPCLGVGALPGLGARLAASCSRFASLESRPLSRRLLLVLASRFPVLGLAELADPFLVVSVTSYLIVVPLCVGLELLFPTILASLSYPSAVWNSSVV